MTTEIVIGAAIIAVLMPLFLEAIGRGDYDQNEGMSVERTGRYLV